MLQVCDRNLLRAAVPVVRWLLSRRCDPAGHLCLSRHRHAMRPVALPYPQNFCTASTSILALNLLHLPRIDLMGGEALMSMFLWELAAIWHC